MLELNKRMKAGWILRDYIVTSDHNEHYYLFRVKTECEIELKPNGYGYIHTSTGSKRI